MAAVKLKGVSKAFGGVEVIRDLSMDFLDGEFIVLVGPSGCGKSTLLRMIAGLEEVSDGTIGIGEKDVTGLAPKDRDIAMVFQNYALYPHMVVADNMSFSLKLKGISGGERASRIEPVARVLGLGDFLGRYPRQLSGGQRQRVAMGRAIVRNPQLFLFDEPLSNLDAKLRIAMRIEVKELHQRLQTTTIYVTHDQIEAMTLADRIVVMRDGVIEQVGTPLELYDQPVNMFVAEFIGSPAINFISGKIEQGGFVSDDGQNLTVGSTPSASEGRAVMLGIRPEHLILSDAGLPAEVVVVEPTGPETHIVARTRAGTDVICVVRERLGVRPKDVVHLQPDPRFALLFDKTATLRIS